MERDLTMMLVGQSRIAALTKWLSNVSPTDGEMVADIMGGVLDSMRGFDLDYLDVPRYEKLQEIYHKLKRGEFDILPVKKEDI